MNDFLETFRVLNGSNEDSKPYLDDAEIVRLVRKLRLEVVWELASFRIPEPHPGYCVEGEFLYDRRHRLFKPNYLGGEMSFSRFDWHKHVMPFGACGMLPAGDFHWDALPNYVMSAFRCKVARFFGPMEDQPGSFKRTFSTEEGTQQVQFKLYA